MAQPTARQLESAAAEKLAEVVDITDEDMEEEEEEDMPETCNLDRPLRKNASDSCAICGEARDAHTPDTDRVLQIEFTEYYIVLCAKHEGMFLRKLLNNYVKRVAKRSKVGYVGPLAKEEEESCGTEADHYCVD